MQASVNHGRTGANYLLQSIGDLDVVPCGAAPCSIHIFRAARICLGLSSFFMAKRVSENTHVEWLILNELALWRDLAYDHDPFGRVVVAFHLCLLFRSSRIHLLTTATPLTFRGKQKELKNR